MEGWVLAGADDGGEPVIEEPPDGEEPNGLTLREQRQRVRQQELLAELGVAALKGTPFPELLDLTARVAAEGLRADFSKVLEHLPAENRLLIRAGVGWPPGIVGEASVGADLASPAGFALRTGKPVISNHLENEERFRTPELLVEHGIRRAMNVILQGDGAAYGVLEVDSRDEGSSASTTSPSCRVRPTSWAWRSSGSGSRAACARRWSSARSCSRSSTIG